MVCPRCVMVVKGILEKLQIAVKDISLGEVELQEKLAESEYRALNEALRRVGFEIVDNQETIMVERIKHSVRAWVREKLASQPSFNDALEKEFKQSFSTLNHLFQQNEGRSIERYFLLQRIEYVKELLQYGELSVKEIAWQTGYSSLPHLSRQFKQITGMTPTAYKEQLVNSRRSIDEV